MVISYLGAESLKVQFGDIVLAYNPVSKDSKIKSVTYGSDVVLSSLNHPDFNGVENASRGEKSPFIINGPGEYEVKGVFVKGYISPSTYGGAMKINTIYTVSLEGINLCFLGALSSPELKDEVIEAMDEIDILFMPIGGEGVLDAASAYKLSVQLEPKIIIPMHYGSVGDKNALKTFLKESGEDVASVDKLTIKKKDLEGKEGDVVVLDPSN
jgi:L-ascorbate metabolism protein UlaG (beta-lactamase superfamily)